MMKINGKRSQMTDEFESNKQQDRLVRLLMLYFVGIPVSDFLNGFFVYFTSVSSFSFLYKSLILLILLVVLCKKPICGRLLFTMNVSVSMITLMLLVHLQLSSSYMIYNEVLIFLKGPMLLSLVMLLLASFNKKQIIYISDMYFISSWLIISLSILLMMFLGISITTYAAGDLSYGSKGLYVSPNEITFVYALSFWRIIKKIDSICLATIIISFLTLLVCYILGTKSGFVMIGILFLWNLTISQKLGFRRALLLSICCYMLVIVFAEKLFLWIGPYLAIWSNLDFYIQKYGVLPTLTGGRFLLLEEVLHVFADYSPLQLLIGAGFQEFWNSVNSKSIESDIIDLFGGGGAMLVIWFYGFLGWGLSHISYKNRHNSFLSGALIATVLYSIFVGHIAFAATPVITVAIILIEIYKENENKKYFIRPVLNRYSGV
ncbi:MAG: O-antigen ligase family protein [Proteobacteria bacterium]|nr:O-antigen ligase family protein [Pseudomonadota bacterium]